MCAVNFPMYGMIDGHILFSTFIEIRLIVAQSKNKYRFMNEIYTCVRYRMERMLMNILTTNYFYIQIINHLFF